MRGGPTEMSVFRQMSRIRAWIGLGSGLGSVLGLRLGLGSGLRLGLGVSLTPTLTLTCRAATSAPCSVRYFQVAASDHFEPSSSWRCRGDAGEIQGRYRGDTGEI